MAKTAEEIAAEAAAKAKEGETTEAVVVDGETADEGTETETGTEGTAADETSAEGETAGNADEVVITIGDAPLQEEEDNKAPEWVRELRKSHRDLARQNRELQAKLAEKEKPAEQTSLGPKPTMADKEIDYDAAKFEVALNKWNDQKRELDNESARKQKLEKETQDAWQAKLNDYNKQKGELKVRDYDESSEATFGALSQTQQGIVVSGSDNAALVIYALGKNPAKLKELAAISDPVKFAFAVAKLEKDLKVTPRKAPPPPEKTVTGTAPKSGVVDSQLEKLRAEAEKTGNYTKVTQYKRLKKQAAT